MSEEHEFPVAVIGPDGKRRIIWRNFLKLRNWKMDFNTLLIVFIVALSVYVYLHDTSVCREFVEDQCGYCVESKCFLPDSCELAPEGYFDVGLNWIDDYVIDTGVGVDEHNESGS